MKKEAIILCSFIILKFFLQFILISPEYELHRDEYLHLDIGHHLAWGYQSVPPLTAWVSKIIYLLGNSAFWVKFFPALFGALTIIVVWKMIKELNGNIYALSLGATCVVFSALLRLNTLYQPNSFDVLSWTTLYFVLIKYFNSEHTKWIYAAGIVFAIGFLNKYNIAFSILGLIPAVLFTGQRKIFGQKQLYYAALLALVIISPNLFWQYANDFPVIRHLNELAEIQLINVDRIDFLKSQILFFAGSLIVIGSGLYALLFHQAFAKYRTFFWAFFFTLIIFLILRAKDYYAIGLYPVYTAFGAIYLSKILNHGWKRYLQPILILLPILFFTFMYDVAFPNKNPKHFIDHPEKYKEIGMLRWEDGLDHDLPQDYADMLGWKELAQKVESVYDQLPNQNQTIIICDNYGQAGAINYYTKHGLRAVTFSADYINWFELDKPYKNLIRVIEADYVESEMNETSAYFESATVAGYITNPYARESGTSIVKFIGAKVDINERLKYEVAEAQNYE